MFSRWSAAVAFCLIPLMGQGSSVIQRTVGQRAREADRVVLARVLESRTIAPEGNPRRMLTLTSVEVTEDYKGTGPARLEIVQLGGRLGDWEARVAGDATFAAGEVALLLLRCRDPAGPGRCNLMALAEGKLRLSGTELEIASLAKGTSSRRSLASVLAEIFAVVGPPPTQSRTPAPGTVR